MLIAIPSKAPGGLESRISEHFGHSDVFTLVHLEDQEVGKVDVLQNQAHSQGGCMAPVMLLKENGVDALVAGGMGMRPLAGFQQVGIRVYYKEEARTAGEAVQLLIDGKCREFGEKHTCGGHGDCGSHGHQHVHREVVDGPVEKDRVVLISYRLTDTDGTELDASDGTGYLHGHGQLLPGLESALEGKLAGEHVAVTLAPQDAYGDRDPSRLLKVPASKLPKDVSEGGHVQVQMADGQVVMLIVAEIGELEATLDANHPLAGRTLVFEVEVLSVQAATPEDLAHHHAH